MKVGPYEVLSEIGRGGMGVVFRGRAPDGRDVALKVLIASNRSTAKERFDRERRLLAELGEEAGFVPLLDDGSTPQGPYIVMPFVAGGTLRAKLHHGPLAVDEAVELGVRLGEALGRAHAAGLVHRDLKPENVLFTASGEALVSDLGLAKHFREGVPGASASVSLSKTGEALGTPGYMPQEQLNDGKTVGPPADVFALGAIVYECLTGDAAFAGETTQERLMKVVEARFVPLRRARPEVPRAVAAVVERALARSAEARFPDGAAFARALDAAWSAPPTRRAPLVAGALVVLAAAAGAAAFFLARGPRSEPRAVTVQPASGATTPGTPAKPAPERPAIPPLCSGFLASEHARLAGVLGDFAFKHAATVQAVALSPDGTLGASGGDDGCVRLWDLATATERRILRGHRGAIIGLDFSPSGELLASASSDRTVRIWDVASGAERFAIPDFPHSVWSAVFSPDGRQLLTACRDGKVRLHDLDRKGATIQTMKAADGIVPSASFSPDGRLAASPASDGVRIWELATGTVRARYSEHKAGVDWAQWTPDGKALLSGGWDATLRLWDAATQKTLRTFEGHTDDVRFGVLTRDGARAFTCSKDLTVRLWDVATGRELWKRTGHRAWILSCAVSRDGRRGFSGGQDGTCRLWDLAAPGGRDLTPEGGHAGAVTAIEVNRDGAFAVTGGSDGGVRVWDLHAARPTSVLLGAHASDVKSIALLEDGDRLLSASVDGTLKLWSRAKGLLWSTEGGLAATTGAAVSPDGTRAVSVCDHGDVATWDLATGKRLATGQFVDFAVRSVAASFSREGLALTACRDGVRLWNKEGDGVSDVLMCAEDDPVEAAAFFADRRSVLLSGAKSLRVKDLRTGDDHVLARGGSDLVAVSADGQRALSARRSKLVLWDLDASRSLDKLDLASAGDEPTSAAFLPRDAGVLVGTRRGVVLRFELR